MANPEKFVYIFFLRFRVGSYFLHGKYHQRRSVNSLEVGVYAFLLIQFSSTEYFYSKLFAGEKQFHEAMVVGVNAYILQLDMCDVHGSLR